MLKVTPLGLSIDPRALNLAMLGGKFSRSHLQPCNLDQSHLLVTTGDK